MVHLRVFSLLLVAATAFLAWAAEDCTPYFNRQTEDRASLDLAHSDLTEARLVRKLLLIENSIAKSEPGSSIHIHGLLWRDLPKVVGWLNETLPGQTAFEYNRRPDSDHVSVTLKVLNKPGQPFHHPAPRDDDNEINW